MLSENIKELRKKNGYSQETLAQELNVVRQTVSKWEKGYSVPDAVMLERMAEIFEVPVSELLGAPEEKEENVSDLKQISDQLAVLNNQVAREIIRKKRTRRKILIIILSVLLAFIAAVSVSFHFFGARRTYTTDTSSVVQPVTDSALNEAVTDAIIKENSGGYMKGMCETSSHLIYATEENEDTVTVYLHEMFSWFGIENGVYREISGGSNPAVYVFRKNGEGYTFVSRSIPRDGAEYTESVKELFPPETADAILSGLSDEDLAEMTDDILKQAGDYLRQLDSISPSEADAYIAQLEKQYKK